MVVDGGEEEGKGREQEERGGALNGALTKRATQCYVRNLDVEGKSGEASFVGM